MAWPAAPGFAPRGGGWAEWRKAKPKPQPSITFGRDSAPDEWAWEAVGLEREEPVRFNWALMGLILMLTCCPAVAFGLRLLLDG